MQLPMLLRLLHRLRVLVGLEKSWGMRRCPPLYLHPAEAAAAVAAVAVVRSQVHHRYSEVAVMAQLAAAAGA